MNSDSLNMVSRLGKGHMPCNFFLSDPQLKTTVSRRPVDHVCAHACERLQKARDRGNLGKTKAVQRGAHAATK